jgi:hypothetical protein
MKFIAAACLSLLLLSCFNTNRETVEMDQLNQRILHLEQRIDSLTGGGNASSIGSGNTLCEPDRCQGITRKGTQCKRKARISGYCWQHSRTEVGIQIITK